MAQELDRLPGLVLAQELGRVLALALVQGSSQARESHPRLRTPPIWHLLQRWQRLGPGCEELRHSARWRKGAWR